MEDHGELPIEDFTHGLYQNVLAIKVALWVIIGLLLFIGVNLYE